MRKREVMKWFNISSSECWRHYRKFNKVLSLSVCVSGFRLLSEKCFKNMKTRQTVSNFIPKLPFLQANFFLVSQMSIFEGRMLKFNSWTSEILQLQPVSWECFNFPSKFFKASLKMLRSKSFQFNGIIHQFIINERKKVSL